jgi:hypothetical protein
MNMTPTYGGAYGDGCTYSHGGISDICQSIQFSTITYTAEAYYSASGWSGFSAVPPLGDGQTYYSEYIYQGIQNTAVSVSSATQFTQTWDTSQQV